MSQLNESMTMVMAMHSEAKRSGLLRFLSSDEFPSNHSIRRSASTPATVRRNTTSGQTNRSFWAHRARQTASTILFFDCAPIWSRGALGRSFCCWRKSRTSAFWTQSRGFRLFIGEWNSLSERGEVQMLYDKLSLTILSLFSPSLLKQDQRINRQSRQPADCWHSQIGLGGCGEQWVDILALLNSSGRLQYDRCRAIGKLTICLIALLTIDNNHQQKRLPLNFFLIYPIKFRCSKCFLACASWAS